MGDSIAVKYDPMGNRVYKSSTVDGVTASRKFIVDISGQLPTILCVADAGDPNLLISSYTYADAQVLSQRQYLAVSKVDPTDLDFNPADPNFYDAQFYVHDRLGSVRLVVDGRGAVVNSTTYTPFGNFYDGEAPAETVENPFKFTGQWLDAEINQYYLRARMYDPTMMRFTGRDLVRGKYKEPMSFHQYLYCANEPIGRIDWNGQDWTIPELAVDMAGYTTYGVVVGFMGGMANIMTQLAMGEDLTYDEMMKTMAMYTFGGALGGASVPILSIMGTGSLVASFSTAEYWAFNGMGALAIVTGVGQGAIDAGWDDVNISSPAKTKIKSDMRQAGISILAEEIDSGANGW